MSNDATQDQGSVGQVAAISPGDMHASLVKDSASSLSAFINVPTGASL
jgi:hypothetical protein